MSSKKIIYQVDAFTAEPFKGNPAGVCILEKPMPEKWMQNIASEMNLSETAFIVKKDDKYKIRFFTPESEISLCGHATLASAHIMYETALTDRDEKIIFQSRAGELTARISGRWVTMNFPAYSLEAIRIPENAENLLGIRPVELYKTQHGWAFALYHGEHEVRGLSPDFKLLAKSEIGNMIVTAPSEDTNFDFCVRCFSPSMGVNEDPVTGSAHSALVPFWNSRTGKNDFISEQVSKRYGILKSSLKRNRVEISGQARTIFKAELFV